MLEERKYTRQLMGDLCVLELCWTLLGGMRASLTMALLPSCSGLLCGVYVLW